MTFLFLTIATWGKLLIGVLLLVYVYNGFVSVDQWVRIPLLRFGRYVQTLGPGLHWVEPFTHTIMNPVAISEEVIHMEAANIRTRDNVPITLQLLLTRQIPEASVEMFITQVFDGENAITRRTLAAVSECISSLDLDQIQHDRTMLHDRLLSLLLERTSHWGFIVKAVEFADIKITDETIETAIALKARAVKEGEAEVARAQFAGQVAEALNIAAATYTPAGRWLKGTEVLLEMSRSAENNTILVATDIVAGLVSAVQQQALAPQPAFPPMSDKVSSLLAEYIRSQVTPTEGEQS